MSDLHQALETLRPKDYATEVPHDDLASYLRSVFKDASVIANSVPLPPGGTDFDAAQPSGTPANAATKAAEIASSPARPPPLGAAYAELAQAWGKPLKIAPRDNVLGITVYKMAARDRHGAWFARTSVHEGLGFDKWKRAMQREFAESLAVLGGPGVGNVRGIGGDRRLEKVTVDGVGKLEVLQLSAQFPGPTAPREFITQLLSTDTCVDYETADPDLSYHPRHYALVSIPVTHPDAPPRDGLVRGQYESVEMIREIPISKAEDAETNPVQWIMITRSDPGGGIPRFMVERGTPSSITTDATKFMNWACPKADFPSEDEDDAEVEVLQAQAEIREQSDAHEQERKLAEARASGNFEPSRPEDVGIVAAHTSATKKPPPDARSETRSSSLHPSRDPSPARSRVSAPSSSAASFASAEENPKIPARVPSNAYAYPPRAFRRRLESSSSSDAERPPSDAASHQSGVPAAAAVAPDKERFDREVAKIEKRRTELAAQLAKAREGETRRQQETSEREAERTRERHERELRKQEERFQREVAKLDQRREKEARRLEERRKKAADKDVVTRTARERDEARRRADGLEAQNKLLLDQVGSLQRENTALVARLGKLEGGPGALQRVRDELAAAASGSGSRSRAGSASASVRTSNSKESEGSGKSGKSGG